MLLIGIIALPCVLMAMGFVAVQRAYRSTSPTRPFFLCPLICSFITTSGFMIWGYHDICTSRSSTAAIGLLFLPFYSLAVAVAGFLISWSCLYVARFVVQRIRGIPFGFASVSCLALAIVLLVLTGYVVQNKVARHRLLNEAASGTDAGPLGKILADGTSSQDLEVLSELAKNSNTPVDALVRIYDFCKPNVTQFNPPEYPVFLSLAQNPRTPPDILIALAGCRQSTVRYAVAINPSTSTKTLRQLAEDQDELVRTYAKPRLRSREHSGNSQQEQRATPPSPNSDAPAIRGRSHLDSRASIRDPSRRPARNLPNRPDMEPISREFQQGFDDFRSETAAFLTYSYVYTNSPQEPPIGIIDILFVGWYHKVIQSRWPLFAAITQN